MTNFSGSGTSVDQLLRMGIESAKQGNKEGAKVMLQQVLQQERRNDVAWFWLASVQDDPEQRKRYLENAVKSNPENQQAKRALDKINRRRARSTNQAMLYGGVAVVGMIILAVLACILVLSL